MASKVGVGSGEEVAIGGLLEAMERRRLINGSAEVEPIPAMAKAEMI